MIQRIKSITCVTQFDGSSKLNIQIQDLPMILQYFVLIFGQLLTCPIILHKMIKLPLTTDATEHFLVLDFNVWTVNSQMTHISANICTQTSLYNENFMIWYKNITTIWFKRFTKSKIVALNWIYIYTFEQTMKIPISRHIP